MDMPIFGQVHVAQVQVNLHTNNHDLHGTQSSDGTSGRRGRSPALSKAAYLYLSLRIQRLRHLCAPQQVTCLLRISLTSMIVTCRYSSTGARRNSLHASGGSTLSRTMSKAPSHETSPPGQVSLLACR